MNMNHSDIKQDILDHLDQLTDSAYPEDLLQELAESAVPIYYNEILADWSEMPSEFNDSWQETGASEKSTIFSLMSMDLYNYYQAQYTKFYEEIIEAHEELENA